jgi:hypothetical protein
LFPYVEHPVLEIGSSPLQAFRVLALTALVVEYTIVVRRAPRHGFTSEQASALVTWGVVLGMISAHDFEVLAYNPERLRDDPFELFRVWGSSSWGGMLAASAALPSWPIAAGSAPRACCASSTSRSTRRRSRSPSTPGCALQHDHLGIASTHFLAVAFPTDRASTSGCSSSST